MTSPKTCVHVTYVELVYSSAHIMSFTAVNIYILHVYMHDGQSAV